MTTPKLPFRTPLLKRIDAFKKRRPDILISPWYQSESGKWETAEPGKQDPSVWVNGTAMMEHLEKAYPEAKEEAGMRGEESILQASSSETGGADIHSAYNSHLPTDRA